MRTTVVLMVLAVSAMAQDKPAVAPACGPKKISFDVTLDESQHALAQPEPGKARVYFVQDLGVVSCVGSCGRVKVGLDGAWAGATQHNSYFSVSVEPGEHHVCVMPQSRFEVGSLVGLAHFNAEAGKIYYFRTRLFGSQTQQLLDFQPIDSDQAGYLIASYPLSVSHPKP